MPGSPITSSARGVFAIAPTPFTPDGAVDTTSLDRLTDFYTASGVTGITVLGQLGEAPKLAHDEADGLMGNRYRVGDEIGRGGMSVVYRAEDTYLGRTVALKVFRRELADADDVRRQREEMQVIARLNHPSLVTLYDAVADDIAERHRAGQPVLVGTGSVEKSEYLANLLRDRGIPHAVLNAKQHADEAKVVAMAGHKGAVTVATTLAFLGMGAVAVTAVLFAEHIGRSAGVASRIRSVKLCRSSVSALTGGSSSTPRWNSTCRVVWTARE